MSMFHAINNHYWIMCAIISILEARSRTRCLVIGTDIQGTQMITSVWVQINPPRTVSRWSSSIFGLTRTKVLGLLLEKLSDSPRAFRIITQKWNQSIESERDYELLGQELRHCGDRA
ncbi:hypothetical protein YC2023_106607 [Brassica napus]